MMYKSLVTTGQKALATGPLIDAIRRVRCFGVCLAPLDIRQVGLIVSRPLKFFGGLSRPSRHPPGGFDCFTPIEQITI